MKVGIGDFQVWYGVLGLAILAGKTSGNVKFTLGSTSSKIEQGTEWTRYIF